MPLKIIREDITRLECDAIVNSANSTLLGGGGVDGAIHAAAGRGLLDECATLGGCRTGEAKITRGYNLPSKYVIHTVGPVWSGGKNGEENLLRSCYRSSLAIAKEKDFDSIAFPLISSGVYGYPKEDAFRIASEEIERFLSQSDMLVFLVIFDRESYVISKKLYDGISSYIDDIYAKEKLKENGLSKKIHLPGKFLCRAEVMEECATCESEPFAKKAAGAGAKKSSLDEALKAIDESFSEVLLRKIDERGMSDSECYKKANIDRKLFSKIRSDRLYRPSKTTAIAFAIALELSLKETKEMLMKAGFALSHSNKFDIIIEYFITNKNYNIFEINEALFAFDQTLLGV